MKEIDAICYVWEFQSEWKKGDGYKINVLYKEQEQTLILKALLKPLAKKPPNGAIIDANSPIHKASHCTGKTAISFQGSYKMLQNEKLRLKFLSLVAKLLSLCNY